MNRAWVRPRLSGLSSRTRTTTSTKTSRFMVPMNACQRKGALHEPTVRSPGFSRPAAWRSFTRSGPPKGGTPNKWRPHGPVHSPTACEKRKGSVHEPPRRRGSRGRFWPVSLRFSLDKIVGRLSPERIPTNLSGRFHSPMFSVFAMFGGRC